MRWTVTSTDKCKAVSPPFAYLRSWFAVNQMNNILVLQDFAILMTTFESQTQWPDSNIVLTRIELDLISVKK